eukprot:Plantae.Rhodophyta-Purpureofilum_apyrenoidigerum.ctg445.p1 GENE.Plantae.Rhodophyta-Purpureofilum_apyrenoidigerum.ctg445~~Plantae.Rhodophyta-Purpureofilum_apyrenoidigerum.ctg445.p1  ORF type:complete len:424 (+),score=83.86 Plantae.Rhodophyta-Purpureofilum_apyrenoidigerum.ctg445:75-1274(+)
MGCCDKKSETVVPPQIVVEAERAEESCCGKKDTATPAPANGVVNGGCCEPKDKPTLKTGIAKDHEAIRSEVREYYGAILKDQKDLLTSACCTGAKVPEYLRTAMGLINDEVTSKYYGCGFCVPEGIEGSAILDLGSGAGRDCYLLSYLVGETGKVVGVDMTDEQLAVANKYRDWHAEKFGHKKSNVEFFKGYIEKLDEVGLKDNSFDVIVSNCVINLCPDKEAALREAHRVLKTGGEMYFSDVYALRRLPAELREDPVLFGECISGAMYWNDFVALAKRVGFKDVRLMTSDPFEVESNKLRMKVEPIKFVSATFRLFRHDELEETSEDYGVAVQYKGTMETSPKKFVFDEDHCFEQGKVVSVCGNTFKILKTSRLEKHFNFYGDTTVHYGPFPSTLVTK